MSLATGVPDARMDPWCLVLLTTGEEILFGFADQHPTTGGLSWMCSSPVQEIDETAGRARTRSGRVYELGQRLRQEDIPAESLEAWVAYDLLVALDADNAEVVPPVSVDRRRDVEWLTACKVARHVRVTPPGRMPAQVKAFFERHSDSYLTLRARGRAK